MAETMENRRWIETAGNFLLVIMPVVSLLDLFPLFQVSSRNVRPTDLLFVPACLLYGWELLFSWRPPKGLGRFLLCILLLISVTGVGVLFVGNSVEFGYWSRDLQTLLWGALGLVFIRNRRRLNNYSNGIVWGAVLACIISLYVYIQNPEMVRVAAYLTSSPDFEMDVPGGINAWASFYVLALIILLWRIQRDGWSLVRGAGLGLISSGLLLIQSRSGFLSLAVILVLFIGFWKEPSGERKPWRMVRAAALVLTFLAGITIASIYVPGSRITDSFVAGSDTADSTNARYAGWKLGMEMLHDAGPMRSLVGYGNERLAQIGYIPTTESFYLDRAVSEGMIGLAVALFLYLAPLFQLRHRNKSGDLYVLVVMATANVLIASLTGNVFVAPIAGGTTLSILYGATAVSEREQSTA